MRHGTAVSVPDSRQRDFHMEKERVLEEARALTRLDSPHIVEVQDAFLENNTAYIVMEYLEGESLQEGIDTVGSLSPDDVRRIAMAACDALAEVRSPAAIFGMPGRIRASRTAKPVHGPGWRSISTSLALSSLGASATYDRMELPLGFLAQCLSATNSDKKNARFAAWSDAGRNGIELKTAHNRISPRYP